jgi:putative intracellular protease/amidase
MLRPAIAVLSWLSTFNGGRPAIRIVAKDGKPAHDHLLKRDFSVNGRIAVETGADLLIVPGGTPSLFICDTELVSEISRLAFASGIAASVCTGAFLVAKTG